MTISMNYRILVALGLLPRNFFRWIMRKMGLMFLALSLSAGFLTGCNEETKTADQGGAVTGQTVGASAADQVGVPGGVPTKPSEAEPARAYQSPDFTLTEVVSGKPLKLSSLKGKIVLLDFWATWCPPCRAEIPHFIDLQKEFGSKGLQVVGLSVDQQAERVPGFIKNFGINYPVVVDGTGRLSQEYGGITGIPTTFLLGKDGSVLGKWVGYNSKEVFEEAIRKAL
jgi:thiol-disulfide isomerase/thioredoxin